MNFELYEKEICVSDMTAENKINQSNQIILFVYYILNYVVIECAHMTV